jgi:spermidine synthase
VVVAAMLTVAGETVMEVRVTTGGGGAGTVIAAVPLTPLTVAVTVVEPDASAVASPAELIVATAGFEDTQAAVAVTTAVEPSL